MSGQSMYNFAIDARRAEEFPHLKDTVYVDHAGATLYSRSQIDAVHKDLSNTLYGNPHSLNASSKLATDTIDQIRYRLLKFFNTTPEEYSLVFTSGCTASLKIVADGFTFSSGVSPDKNSAGVFCYLDDSHTSTQGMRETVSSRASDVICLDDQELQTSLTATGGEAPTVTTASSSTSSSSSSVDPVFPRSLVAFPAQSNFSGRKYPLQWVQQIQNQGLVLPGRSKNSTEEWYVLLDTAAYASTTRLDLSDVTPDFVTVSFYKIFGYPTGLGALLVSKRAWSTLHKTYFGGGTVAMSTARERIHAFRLALHDRFEDGTPPYLSIISLRHGLDTVQRLAGGMEKVSRHVFAVARYFYSSLKNLRHGNGQPLALIYGEGDFTSPSGQGGLVTFNLQRADGKFIGYAEVDKFAQLHDVHLRTGCFCNIGACQRYLKLSSKVIKENFAAGHVCGDNMDLIDGQPTGAVRISFGYMSTLSDARVCLRFIADTFLDKPAEIPLFSFPEWYVQRSSEVESTGSLTSPGNAEMKTKREEVAQNGTVKNDLTHVTNGDLQHQDAVTGPSVSETCSESTRRVTDIYLYPLKSCGAFRTSEWEMGTKGLLYDREWILVSDTGVTIGQKREPRICLLCPEINLSTRKLILSFPGASPFELPLDQEQDFDAVASFCTNKVCGDRVNTFDCGDAVSDWLSYVFHTPGIRLLRPQSDDTRRSKLKDKTADGQAGSEEEKPRLSMANESQLLVLSRASVRELQNKMADVVDVDDAQDTRLPTAPANIGEDNLIMRFRGNLVIDGGKAFEEDTWAS
ncbi:molybdenum cofactor sulfurase, partial [Aplysia californica]|uniref:Molybdenum cofactor sulfurase n=1 Tax=Aplysia californica TaxID=6500 RepID=A0ABM0ZZI1_APLCA